MPTKNDEKNCIFRLMFEDKTPKKTIKIVAHDIVFN